MRLRAIGFVALMILACACGDDAPRVSATSVPFATEAPEVTVPPFTPFPEREETAGPTPDLAGLVGVRLQEMRVGPPMPFPEDTALIIETGCTSCDAPATGVKRIYRNKGALHVDELFRRPEQQRGNDIVSITSDAVSEDGGTLVVAVCTRGYCGGMGFPTADAAASFYVSRDGGVTWVEEPQSEMVRIFAITSQGWITGRWWTDESIWVDGRRVQRPAAATGLFYGGRTTGSLLWTAKSRVLNADGSELVRIDQAEEIYNVVYAPGQAPIVGWIPPGAYQGFLLTRQAPSSEHIGYRYQGFFLSTVLIDPDHFYTDVDDPALPIGRIPAIVDFETGVVSPFAGVSGLLQSGRATVIGAYRGPFLRVEAGEGCLSVYEQPDESTPVVACLATKVLVRDLLRSAGGGGKNWSGVELLDGHRGWAESAYLRGD
jgi:hypothetical protein